MRVEGEPRPLPAGVGLAAYRITQEALTNVIKHAGPAHASVLLRYTADDMTRRGSRRRPRHRLPDRNRRARSRRHARTSRRPRRRTDRRPRHRRRVRGHGPPAGHTGIDMTIRVAIADDQPLVRAGFATMVSYAEDLELVGEADNGADAVAVARRTRPDVFLMDIRMPTLDGLEATRQITGDPDLTGTRIIILTTFDLDDYVHQALRNGASGFLVKDARPEDILNAIRVVAAGDALLAPSVTRRLIERFTTTPAPTHPPAELTQLTEREAEVLILVAQGRSNAEIADQLYISLYTAKTHVSRILTKLGARDRAQLVIVAYETGLISPGK